jgi:hypothetical protein
LKVQPDKLVDVRAGERVTVNGRTFEGPLQIARTSKLVGVAFVSRGADSETTVIVASMRNIAMEVSGEFTGRIEGTIENSADPAVDVTTSDTPDVNAAAILAAERQRVATIESLTDPEIVPEAAGKLKRIRASAIAGKMTLDQTREKVLALVRADRPQAPPFTHRRGTLTRPSWRRLYASRLRIPQEASGYDERTNDAAHKAFRGRLGLQQLLIMAAASNGYQCRPGERLTTGSLKTVLAYALPSVERQIDAAFSTVSLPGILSNVANKELLLGYESEDQSWREISAVKSVGDFKQHTSYRLLDNMEYELLPKGGKIKHGTVGEETYTRQARTYAKIFSLTREDIINDDLSAFDDLRNRLGRGAAQRFNRIFWAAFLDNATFFTSGNGNLLTGNDTALTVAGDALEDAVIAFRGLRTPEADGSKRISGKPEILLVPPELEFIARKLYVSTNVVGGSSAVPSENVFYNQYRPVVVDWLSDSDFTGYSAKAWYLFRSHHVGAYDGFVPGWRTDAYGREHGCGLRSTWNSIPRLSRLRL